MRSERALVGMMRGGFSAREESGRLFSSLCDALAAKRFDDSFLELVALYHEACPASEKPAVFYAEYALAHSAYTVAVEYAEKAYEKRKADAVIWNLLARCYRAAGRLLMAIVFEGMYAKHMGESFDASIPRAELTRYLESLSLAMGDPRSAPWLLHALAHDEQRGLFVRQEMAVGRFLPQWPGDSAGAYPLWCGVYNRANLLDARGDMLAAATRDGLSTEHSYIDLIFDFMKARIASSGELPPSEAPYVLPLAGLEHGQKISFQTEAGTQSTMLGHWEFSFFRIDRPVRIEAERPFVMGKPIFLCHSPHRRKVVLNILIDALSWSVVKRHDFRWMPNVMRFFSKGIIFNNHYAVAEYTFPSLASIETGMMVHHTQIFHPGVFVPLSRKYKTISEKFAEAGYYCVEALGGDASGVYTGVSRGFDRLLVNQYETPIHCAVDQAMEQMEAFSECDLFLFLHTLDCHPNCGGQFQNSLASQTKVSFPGRLQQEKDRVSVLLAKSLMNTYQNQASIRRTDFYLGGLFSWLEAHYAEEEYIVHLYSDHGASVYSEHPWFLSEEQNCSAFMMRGAGIPALGVVEELTSGLDIYPCVMRNAGLSQEPYLDGNLPAALGGWEREYTISNSIYPGQTFKLCIRSKEHEFRLETDALTAQDGTVDCSAFSYGVYTRDAEHREIFDERIARWFLEIAEKHVRDGIAQDGQCWPQDAGEG